MISIRRKKQSGIALMLTMMVSVIILISSSVLVFMISGNASDIIHTKQKDSSINIAEEGFEHIIDHLNNQNNPGTSVARLEELLDTTASQFISDYNSDATEPLAGVHLIQSYINQNNNQLFSNGVPFKLFNSVSTSNSETKKFQGQFELAVEAINEPEFHSPDYDLYKIASFSYVPSKDNPKSKRSFMAIVQRPKVYSAELNNAILSEGNVNLGNADTGASDTSVTLTTTGGDVHSNSNLSVGPNGVIDGNASAVGTVYVSSGGVITGTNVSGAPELPIPEPRYDVPVNACSPDGDQTIGNHEIRVFEDCILTGNLRMSNGSTVIIKGTFLINGTFSQQGGSLFSAGNFSKLVATKEMSTAGNTNNQLTDEQISGMNIDPVLKSELKQSNKMIFISDPHEGSDLLEPAIKVTGNSYVQGLFVSKQKGAEVVVNGGGTVFGSIISNGDVTFQSNNTKIVRDLSFTNSPFLYFPNSHVMRVVSWKELNKSDLN